MTDLLPASPASRDLTLTPAESFDRAKEAFTLDNALDVPASQGKEPVKILPVPAYFRTDHGYRHIEFDDESFFPTSTRAPESYYAAYLFQTGNGELRFVVVPVALYPNSGEYNRSLAGDMANQGFNPDAIGDSCKIEDVQKLFGNLGTPQLRDLREIMQRKEFSTTGYHPRAGTYIYSGWDPQRKDLTIIGPEFVAHTARMNPHFNSSEAEKYATGVFSVSAPLNPQTENPLEKELLARVVDFNK